MKTSKNTLIYMAVLLISVWTYVSCSSGKETASSRDAQTGTLALQQTLTTDVVVALQQPVAQGGAGMTEAETAAIKTGALAIPSLALAEETGEEGISKAATRVAKGAIAALNGDGTGLTNDIKKIAAAKVISGALIKSAGENMGGAAADIKTKLPGMITGAAIGALDDGGIAKDSLARAVKDVTANAVAFMDEGKFTEGEDFSATMSYMMEHSVGQFDELGLDSAGVTNIMDDFMSGAVSAIDELGFAGGAEDYKVFVDDMLTGCFAGFDDIQMTEAEMAGMFDDAMAGAVGALDDIGLDKGAAGDLVSHMSGSAVAHMDDLTFINAAMMDDAFKEVASGIARGMDNMVDADFMTMADMQLEMKDVTAATVDAMFEIYEDPEWDLGTDFGELTGQFTDGIEHGMYQGGMTYSEINAMDAYMDEGFDHAMEGEENFDPAWAETMDRHGGMDESFMAQDCVLNGGSWNDAEKFCEFTMFGLPCWEFAEAECSNHAASCSWDSQYGECFESAMFNETDPAGGPLDPPGGETGLPDPPPPGGETGLPDPPSDGGGALLLCPTLGHSECMGNSICSWNQGMEECQAAENDSGSGGGALVCSDHLTDSACNQAGGSCYWDPTPGECLDDSGGSSSSGSNDPANFCPTLADESQCLGETMCSWNAAYNHCQEADSSGGSGGNGSGGNGSGGNGSGGNGSG
ncbi:MAG: hypothetical protein CMP10_01430, partial [Zetaproteobacteria bacterium]|nr:hypothetical protein [Pseudobdellovibrionaceae bacterium]